MDPVRILVADDHPLFRSGVRSLLAEIPDLDVVGCAATGEEVVSLTVDLQPDVILMDLQMPGLSGIDATRRILEAHSTVGILVVTMFEDDYSVFAAMRAGARGYVLKDAAEDELLRAIRAVAHGEAIFSPSIARRLVDFFAGLRPQAAPTLAVPPARAFPELTEREREVLDLIARGSSNPEISGRLCVSPKTVRNHISSIFSKLQVADRAQAIIQARKAGLG